ncbi:MAG: RDD family protein [Terriglobales bacterium]
MDCPTGGVAAVQARDSCADNGTAEEAVAAVGAAGLELDAEYWRREVAARLERYRARRKPRAPRYPSLRLPFDSPENWLPGGGSSPAMSATAPAHQCPAARIGESAHQETPRIVEFHSPIAEEPEPFANVIEFPRSAAIPIHPANELAEPVSQRPRIVEAPEVLPPPPALGGFLMEPSTRREPESRAGLPLPSASLPRRLLAGLLDGLILAAALASFGAIFLWLNAVPPPMPVLATAVIIVAILLWMAYEFLFVVYTGSTPGLRLARLRLTRFDGSPVRRRARLWRVLTSYLSAFSLGLGYLWAVLDEDGLCWHDRITRTHLS